MATKRDKLSDEDLTRYCKLKGEVDKEQTFTMQGDLGFGFGLKPGALTLSTTGRALCSVDGMCADNRLGLCSDNDGTRTAQRACCILSDINLRELDFSRATSATPCSSRSSAPREKTGFSSDGRHSFWTSSGDYEVPELVAKLKSSTEEIGLLQNELQVSKQHLDSKLRAIKILQSQYVHALVINKDQTKSIQKAGQLNKSLEQEVNSLQFDLSASEGGAKFNKHIWTDTLARLCTENDSLVSTLQGQSENIYHLQLANIAFRRERDELLARMDAKERLQYDRHQLPEVDPSSDNLIAEQLAILGACLCRGSKPEPCQCAREAAKLKQEKDRLNDEVDHLSQTLELTKMMADSFLAAFETQLDQNHFLSLQISKACSETKTSSSAKNKSVHRRKLSSSQKDVTDIHLRYPFEDDSHDEAKKRRSVAVQVSEPLPELINTLTDLLNNKTEALAHQRLVTKLLARKTQELERTMQQLSDYNLHAPSK